MFRCKVMAFTVLDFYIGLLEHFKKSSPWEEFNKKLKFQVIHHKFHHRAHKFMNNFFW